MLKVKTKLGRSLIAGIGLFADEFIHKGTVIWEQSPGLDIVLSKDEYDSLGELDKAFFATYSFRCHDEYILCIDNSRFINHSDDPNTDDSTNMFTLARKDIWIGEEITSNYKDFGRTDGDKAYNQCELRTYIGTSEDGELSA